MRRLYTPSGDAMRLSRRQHLRVRMCTVVVNASKRISDSHQHLT